MSFHEGCSRSTPRLLVRVLALALGVLAIAGTAFAQLQSGNLYGTTKDEKGAALPGVSVTLTGQGAPQNQVTDAQGQFRFLGLSPGSYAVKAELQGFSTVDYPNVVISIGRNTTIEVALSGAVEDVITVTAESPVLDEKRIGQTSTVSQAELAKIPSSRDPWAVLMSTPGVLTDRINVGGNESGQQSLYVGPGSTGDQAVWSMDGVVITDMAATGSSPGYYDFDSFEEMQVTTGGSDSSVATPGVTLNMVTKRGTNEWRGSGRYYLTNDSLQSDLSFSKSDLAKAGPWRTGAGATNGQAAFKQGNRISKIQDWGLELGGPIVKDKLWVWGSYSKPQIDLLTVSDFSDKSTLEDWNGKLNWQIAQSNSAQFFGWNSDKVKIGRNAGPLRPQETTWDQSKFGPSPTAYKAEDTQIFSGSFYLTALYSKVNGGFQLIPEGGEHVPFRDLTTQWHNSYLLATTLRPQEQFKADASAFFNTGSLGHELKFGAGHRTATVTSLTHWSANALEIQVAPNLSQIGLVRDGGIGVEGKYDSAYVQDTFTTGNLTANVGLRYDKQTGRNEAGHFGANPQRPDLLPAVTYAGGGIGFDWTSITPRVGVTYALGADRKTLLRASYSQFADQLANGFAGWLNPLAAPGYAYFYTPVRSGHLVPGDFQGDPAYFSGNVNPITGGLLQSNAVDHNLKAPLTHEALLSVEHALLPEFVVGLNLTYRKYTDALEPERLVFDCPGTRSDCAYDANLINTVGRKNRASDYVPMAPITGIDPKGNAYSIPIYQLRPGVASRNGTALENGDREQEYKGLSLIATKRLSNRWMMRGNFTVSDWKWKAPRSEDEDPTRILADSVGGQPVIQGSGTGSGAKGNVYINSKWSYSLNALYQIAPDRPWGFNVAGNMTGRQGYPLLYFNRSFARNIPDGAFGINIPVTGAADRYRYDDIHQLDLRVDKDFTFSDFGLTLSVDCFNVLNRATVLQRNGRQKVSTSDNVIEIVSPRLFRVGAKFSFR